MPAERLRIGGYILYAAFCFLFIPTSYRFHGEAPSQRGNQGAFMLQHISAGCRAEKAE